MPVDMRQTVLDNLSYGLYIVTSHLDGKPNGQITDALMQVTAFPPRVAVGINKNELTHEYIAKSSVFGVSILSRSADMKFIGLFGFNSGRNIDKLSRVKHKTGQTGCPLVTENTVAVFEVKVREAIDLDTHTLFVGDVLSGEIVNDAEILTYRYYTRSMKGKVSKNSPSFHGDADTSAVGGVKAGGYICDVCGYVYDSTVGDPNGGIPPGTPFEKLPDNWVCPICGADKTHFLKHV